MPKTSQLNIRLPTGEARAVADAAAEAGTSVSALVRGALRERAQFDRLAAELARNLASELRAEIQAQAAERDAKLEAGLKTIEAAIANQVNRGYFIKVTQHLSKQLAAVMAHHKIAMPKDKDGES